MTSDELGSGLSLDQSFDFEIASDGDLRAVSGFDELNKDLGFQLTIILGDLKGQPLTPDVRGEIKSLTIDTLSSDERVLSVNESGIRIEQIGRETLRLAASYDSVEGPQELVFTL